MNRLLTILLLLLSTTGNAQDFKRTWNWYFGSNAGMSFATNPPTPLTDGAMNTVEGCATISDTIGNLLFYTNGETVYNKNHQVMQNGTGLLGSWDATQSSIIIPQPGNDSIYYIFTADARGFIFGLQSHIININKQGGLGEVVIKNIKLQTPVCEKLTATRHQNGRDIWVLAHGFKNNLFYAYLLTNQGLVSCPVVAAIGAVHGVDHGFGIQISDAQGAMKFNKEGTRLAVSVYDEYQPYIELFDFNKSNGVVNNMVRVPDAGFTYYLEFSPNNRFLYSTNRFDDLYQFDLSSGIGDSIRASRYTVYDEPSFQVRHAAMQLAPDNKIYLAFRDSGFISTIENPNLPGTLCGFNLNGFNLGGKKSKYGLPNFISSYFHRPRLDFGYLNICSSNMYQFYGKDTLSVTNWQWRIQKGSNSTAYTTQNITHTFADTGTYEVSLIAGVDTVLKTIRVEPVMQLNLGSDITLCNTDSLVLYTGNGYYCYQWQDSSTASTYTVKQNGTYYVSVVTPNMQCTFRDTIQVQFSSGTISKPTISRYGDSLMVPQVYNAYQWYLNNQPLNGAIQHFAVRSTDGSYKVQVTNTQGCSIFSDVYITTDVPEFAGTEISIYPNPVTDLLQITGAAGTSYALYNLLGQQVLTGSCEQNKQVVSLQGLQRGYYLLLLKDVNGSTKPYKIVKE